MKLPFCFLLLHLLIACSSKTNKIARQNPKEQVFVLDDSSFSDPDNVISRSSGGAGGNFTVPLEDVTQLLHDRDYDQIRQRLQANCPASKYLATIVCEMCVEKGLFTLTNDEKACIRIIKNSTEKVGISSGCTMSDEFMLWELFIRKEGDLGFIEDDFEAIIDGKPAGYL